MVTTALNYSNIEQLGEILILAVLRAVRRRCTSSVVTWKAEGDFRVLLRVPTLACLISHEICQIYRPLHPLYFCWINGLSRVLCSGTTENERNTFLGPKQDMMAYQNNSPRIYPVVDDMHKDTSNVHQGLMAILNPGSTKADSLLMMC